MYSCLLQVTFEGVVGSTSFSDIAIDDVEFLENTKCAATAETLGNGLWLGSHDLLLTKIMDYDLKITTNGKNMTKLVRLTILRTLMSKREILLLLMLSRIRVLYVKNVRICSIPSLIYSPKPKSFLKTSHFYIRTNCIMLLLFFWRLVSCDPHISFSKALIALTNNSVKIETIWIRGFLPYMYNSLTLSKSYDWQTGGSQIPDRIGIWKWLEILFSNYSTIL